MDSISLLSNGTKLFQILRKKHYLGIQAFLSEKGLFKISSHTVYKVSSRSRSPQHAPEHQMLQPQLYQAPIHEHEPIWSPSILLIGILGFVMALFAFRTKYKRLVALILGCSILCSIEGSLEIFDQPTYAQIHPLFSFINFSFDPYEEIYRNDQKWWISQGGPTRWQEIPVHDKIFRIAVLGASSAHV